MEERMKNFWVIGLFFLAIGGFIGFLVGYSPGSGITGAAVSEAKCFDADGGKNFVYKGYAVDDRIRYFDNCVNDKYLYEAYCGDDQVKVIKFRCGFGCADGACTES